MERTDCVVIGGGPAGMMCAATAAAGGVSTVVVEKNPIMGKKLRITGKGRCNVTNKCTKDVFFDNVTDNPRFMYGPYAAFTCDDTISFFENLGVPLKTERGNRVFPVSDKAADIADALEKYCRELGVSFVKAECTGVNVESGRVTGVTLRDGKEISCDCAVIATGGFSYRSTGSTGDGYTFAKRLCHSVTELRPSLVPLEIEEESVCAALQGLSLKNVSVSVVRGEKNVFTEFGEMLFTHFGMSGPLILSASCYAKGGDSVFIDLKPALSEEVLDRRVCSDFTKYSNKNFSNSLCDLLPSKLIPVVVSLSGIPADAKVNSITKSQRTALVDILKHMRFTVKGTRPINEAIITSGGVDTRCISSDMQSKTVQGLFFAGEVIDVAAYTGGFNLQIAFSTGYRAGKSIAEKINK